MFAVVGALLAFLWAAPALSRTDRPLWVVQRPSEQGHWVGIGIARIQADLARAREEATQSALADLARQIETTVHSDAHLGQAELGGTLWQVYRGEIRTRAAARLEGAEIVATWEDGEHCWVYARLSIEAFHHQRRSRTEQVRGLLARAAETRAESAARALSLCVQALRAAQEAPEAMAEAELCVQEVLSSVQLRAWPLETPLKRSAPLDIPLRVAAHAQEGGSTSGLPVRFAFASGDGELVDRAWTGPEGVAFSRLLRVGGPDGERTISARIDPAAFLPADSADSGLARRLDRLDAPSVALSLRVVPRTIHIAGDPGLGPALRAALSELGLGLAERAGQADLVLETRLQVRCGNRVQGLCFAFAQVELKLSTPGAEGALLHTSPPPVKAAGTTCEQAEERAREQVGARLREQILPELLEGLDGMQPRRERR